LASEKPKRKRMKFGGKKSQKKGMTCIYEIITTKRFFCIALVVMSNLN
jgi:hypothetical protein